MPGLEPMNNFCRENGLTTSRLHGLVVRPLSLQAVLTFAAGRDPINWK